MFKLNSVSRYYRILLFGITLEMSSEENCEDTHKRKSLRYADLMANCKEKGCSVWLFPVEVAAKGS